jgi:hypothetical protein
VSDILIGAIAMGNVIAALFFLRFWRSSRDRFFLYFALSFGIEGLSRLHFGLAGAVREDVPIYYMIRVVSYGLILWAILEKNLPRRNAK